MSKSKSAMVRFERYVEVIERLAQGDGSFDTEQRQILVRKCLDGGPASVLRREFEIKNLRKQGAFFTGSTLATKLATKLDINEYNQQVIFDPTCGAGDLLMAVAKRLPIADTFRQTIDTWGEILTGCDIVPEFVRLAKARLVLLAAKRCRIRLRNPKVDLSATFPLIVKSDFLDHSLLANNADSVIMNPPYGYTNAPSECEWAQGRVSAAALFTERTIQHSRDGTRVLAVLPEVLRSGSRYRYWRRSLKVLGTIRSERSLGLFDRWADVDVYLLDFTKNLRNHYPYTADTQQCKSRFGGVGKRFSIHVGAVVPHRHPEEGVKLPYIHARSLPPWCEVHTIDETRRFNGRVFRPPFVVVRRTSRPDSGKRAVATLVLCNQDVAIENHLIVMIPKDGNVETCRALLKRLRADRTDCWINSRLRCRHLTTVVLAEMPWWKM